MSKRTYPRYDRKRNRWTKSEMLLFANASNDAGAAAALAAAQEHYGANRVIEVVADGYIRDDPAQGTLYRPRLRAANYA